MAKRRKQTKAQQQRTELWQHARTGPYQATATLVAHTDNSDNARWMRATHDHFQPSNNQNVRVVIDAQHARSRVFSLQTASQFGYGIYDMDVYLVASYDAINPEDGRFASTQVRATYMEPTPLRMDALKALKGIERLDDKDDPFSSASADTKSHGSVNPLLAIAMDDDADTASGQYSAPKGNRIIRFTFSDDSPLVYSNSALDVDLNADGDTNDTKEFQHYCLIGDNPNRFGIMPRMEAAVNPAKSTQSGRMVDVEWKNPTNSLKVNNTTFVQEQAIWSQNIKLENTVGTNLPGGIHTENASFRGIRALGGLIQLTIPEMFTSGVAEGFSANNDYEILVNLRCRKWVPLA